MSNIDKRALREAAEKASTDNHTQDEWFHYLRCSNPETVLALLDEIAELEQGHCGAALLEREESHAKTVGKLLDELEAKDQRIAELSALQGKPIAWESTTPVYVKFITDERYQRLRPGYKKWYKPYRCSQCAAAGKGEAS